MRHGGHRRRFVGVGFTAVLALSGAPGAAVAENDGTPVELPIGGLLVTPSPDLSLRQEDVTISASEVRIRYAFLNRSTREVTSLVTFPLPDLDARADNFGYLVLPQDDQSNFVGFKARVDGQTVPATPEQSAFSLGLDRTDLLKQAGVPLNPALSETGEALKGLTAPILQELRVAGLVDQQPAFPADNRPDDLETRARWLLKTTFFWQQVFPPGKVVVIDHTYSPSVGGPPTSPLADGLPPRSAELAFYQKRYCVDDAFLKAAVALKRKLGPDTFLMEKRIAFAAPDTAARTGPITSYTLTVDKGSPDALVSFCADDVRRVSPTQVQMTRTDYTPTSGLAILILDKVDKPADTEAPADGDQPPAQFTPPAEFAPPPPR